MISRIPRLEHLDDRTIDRDERNEANRMYGTAIRQKNNRRVTQQLESLDGIMLKEFSRAPTPSSVIGLEAADDLNEGYDNFSSIAAQEASSTETVYYTFEEHIQYLTHKFSEKFKAWKESFKLSNSSN